MKILKTDSFTCYIDETGEDHCNCADFAVKLPTHVFNRANLSDNVDIDVMDGAILATSKEMTVLQLLHTIESLEDKLQSFYTCLHDNFSQSCDYRTCDCDFCSEFMDLDMVSPDWIKKIKEANDFFGVELHDITDLSDEMIVKLSNIGFCLDEINYAIMDDEIITISDPEI